MTNQKPTRDMTTDEAMAHLFHPKAVEHLRKTAKESDERGDRRVKGSGRSRGVIKPKST